MIKYAVSAELIQELLDLGLCRTEDDAREKVASGAAPELIKQAHLELLKKEGLYAKPNESSSSKGS
tara:strand:- start:1592 stop:1789 length:198 start_codon:yes stop_codon:yes gene_type:complete